MASPREPKEDTLPQAAASALNVFLEEAFPGLAPVVKSFMPGLEYNHEGITYQYISALDENQADTGIVFVIRPEPDLKIIYYTCLDQ
jgi:hypothetical protein